MAVQLVIAKEARLTGRILKTALTNLGLQVSDYADNRVSYGVPLLNSGRPTLNGNAGKVDKLEALRRIQNAGVTVPPFYVLGQTPNRFPLLARKRHHKGGTDIMPVFMPEEMQWRYRAGAEFFVEYIPWVTEYRVWVFRKAHLGTYQKVLAYPEQYRKVGCNHKNGFAFQLVTSDYVPRAAVDAAVLSIRALDLDFGAVDVLQGKDGRSYVLEVNTAPGVESATRQVMRSLADKIYRWNANPVNRE